MIVEVVEKIMLERKASGEKRNDTIQVLMTLKENDADGGMGDDISQILPLGFYNRPTIVCRKRELKTPNTFYLLFVYISMYSCSSFHKGIHKRTSIYYNNRLI